MSNQPSKKAKKYAPLEPANFEKIPPELAALRQWVCWGPRAGKDKTPINPHDGSYASSTDSATWGTLGQAVQRYSTHREKEKLNGIGFTFSKDDPYTGIDLDHCRDPETGEIQREALALIEKINSYTESSVSGTGIHIIVRAEIPKSQKKTEIEMYNKERYFCFTGRPAWKNLVIENRQAEVMEVYVQAFGEYTEEPEPLKEPEHDALFLAVRNIPDADLLDLLRKNEKHFAELWEGTFDFLKKDKSASSADYALCIHLGRYTRLDAARTENLFRQSALHRQKWEQRDGTHGTYGKRTIAKAFAEIVKKNQSLYDPTEANSVGPRRLSDGTNTDAFIKLTNNSFAWVPEWDTWLHWNGVYWQRGAEIEVFRSIRMVSDALWAESRRDTEYKELAKWAKETDNLSRQNNVERWARNRLNISSHKLDQHPYLLACKNGVVDLRTGSISFGERTDYLTRGLEWSYLPEAECPIFDQFLEDIMLGNEEMIEYMWRVIGYCLTGETGARAFFILYGTGKNGKSTFARALQTLLGMKSENYAQTARFETFLQQQRQAGNADPDIAGLAGARIVVASEVNPGEKYRLDGGKIKQFTGEDWMKARFLYSPEFQFLPVCKIFLLVNDVPHIDETARALYDRLHYISFNYRVPEEKQDGMLHWRLHGEMEGILAKAIQYAQKWYETGTLAPPEEILKARDTLAQEMDSLSDFWNDRCVIGPNFECEHKPLYADYLGWAETQKIKYPYASNTFSKHLRKRGYKRKEVGHDKRIIWLGIGLQVQNMMPETDTEIL